MRKHILGRLMASKGVRNERDIAKLEAALDNNTYFKRALQFANEAQFQQYTRYNDAIKSWIEKKSSEWWRKAGDRILANRTRITLSKDSYSNDEARALKYDGTIIGSSPSKSEDSAPIISINPLITAIGSEGVIIAVDVDRYSWHETSYTLYDDGRVFGKNAAVPMWEDILTFKVGYSKIVGLKTNGNVVIKRTPYPRDEEVENEVTKWSNIIDIAIVKVAQHDGYNYDVIVGVKADYTLVCSHERTWSKWVDIKSIYARDLSVAAIKVDGTVIFTRTYANFVENEWYDIVELALGDDCVIGLRADGVLLHAGNRIDGLKTLSERTNVTE